MEKRRFHVRGVFAAVLLAAWVTATGGAGGAQENTAKATEPDWIFECAACFHTFHDLGPRSAQFDADGVLHVVYGGESLYHAWQSAGGWQVEIIDDGPEVGSQAALVIGSDAAFHVFYLDEKTASLRYASGTTGSWSLETITAAIGEEPWPSPAIAADGQLHVAFRDGIQNQIVVATRNGSGWSFSTVDATGGKHPSLALDSSGRPHLSYVMAVPGELRYAYDDGGWQVETVRSDVRALQTGLAIDATGRAHLAYSGPPDEHWWDVLMYTYRDAGGWHHEVADSGEDDDYVTFSVGSAISLVLDAEGQPRVAYTSYHSSVIPYPWRYFHLPRYAARDATGWSVTVFSEYADTQKTGLALDNAGQPYVFYSQIGNLIHRFFAVTWQSEVVDFGGVAGIAASMALDAGGTAHVSSIGTPVDSYSDKLLYTTQHTVAGWQSEMVALAGYDGYRDYTALDVALDGSPHILFNTYSRFSGSLRYLHRDYGEWRDESVSDSNVYDVAVADDGRVHAAWVTWHWEGPDWLLYGTLPSLLEPTELIGEADTGNVSLAIDDNGRPHAAYAAGGGLRYAFRDDSGWHEEIVASGTFGVGQVSLALDSYGRPHISFYAATSGDLFYAYRDSGGWHLEQVDWGGDVGQYTSIAVTDSGQPHISYYDATNHDLKYARRYGTGWSVETVASEGNVGLYTSIAIYNGYPHISYHDATRGDLMYVYKPFIPVAFSYLPLVAR